ncbi:MAG: aldehyde dehydrogenase family protein [Anaerolineaceae bacterium]|nr:aldehyde dehydrogenase family protein [Anaerolineaceae bacterium]MBN2677105.1 aldehyde dehydrogenase family protein [Anaerolineaceae bacterium]
MSAGSSFKLTYATMFNPPEELHTRFSNALDKIKANLGKEHAMIIDGKDVLAKEKFEDRSPANTDIVLGVFQKGTADDANKALVAARKAFPTWSHMKWQERVALVRRAAEIMDRRIYEISAVVSMEVGKNRMEALGDVAETADLIRYSCDRMEANDGFIAKMSKDPLVGFNATNTSVLRPYGVWLVISPFNFPCALTGGPAGAALVTGNTLVMKPATDTPWTTRLIAECFREAGLPDGVYNFISGPGSTLGQAAIDNPEVDGITFTGSYDVGMKIYRDFGGGKWVRPTILELGGKNPVIVSKKANLEDAAVGITRSAFGLQGQKCSAASRVYIQEDVYDELVAKIIDMTSKLVIGEPTDRKTYMGPVINKSSYADYQKFVAELSKSGRILTGGKILTDGEFAKGYFCSPTIVVDLDINHPLWKTEMFLPIVTIAKVKDMETAMVYANDVSYGLTAGFYGSQKEADWFFDNIEAGVTYANRPQGATTGAWPGFQPFGGWKGSGSSGKNGGGLYYLPLYMREQIHTLIKRA